VGYVCLGSVRLPTFCVDLNRGLLGFDAV